MSLCIDIQKKHPLLRSLTLPIEEQLTSIFISVLETVKNIDSLTEMCTQQLMNGLEVIDAVTKYDLKRIIQHPIIEGIIMEFWNGPYQTSSFLSTSYCF